MRQWNIYTMEGLIALALTEATSWGVQTLQLYSDLVLTCRTFWSLNYLVFYILYLHSEALTTLYFIFTQDL